MTLEKIKKQKYSFNRSKNPHKKFVDFRPSKIKKISHSMGDEPINIQLSYQEWLKQCEAVITPDELDRLEKENSRLLRKRRKKL